MDELIEWFYFYLCWFVIVGVVGFVFGVVMLFGGIWLICVLVVVMFGVID